MNPCRVLGVLTPLLLAFACTIAGAQVVPPGEREIVRSKAYKPLTLERSENLDTLVANAVSDFQKGEVGKGVKADDIAITVIDMSMAPARVASHRGGSPIYPASVVKMFYMAALYQQDADGKLAFTPELERGLKDMIVDSSNEATQYIIDVLTDTSSGGELPADRFAVWSYRRNRMNRYFASMGYTGINVNQKTHCEDAYGVEQQFRNYKGENRNMLTTDAAARLIAEIATGHMVDSAASSKMMELLRRDPFVDAKKANSQAVDFSGKALIDAKLVGAKLWSKAGWTSRTRHDAAYIELLDGRKFAIAVFTENHAGNKEIIPTIVRKIIEGTRK